MNSNYLNRIVFCLSIFILLGATSLLANDYFPLEIGNYWTYNTPTELRETRTVIGMETFVGTETFAIGYTENPGNLGLQNYWTNNSEGDVFLWGFSREFGLSYDPPIMIVDSPLTVGKTWDIVSGIYSYPSGEFLGSAEFTFEVLEDGIYQVDAGSFPAFGVGVAENERALAILGKYSLDGKLRQDDNRGVDSWFTDGVGEIMNQIGNTVLSLESYHGTNVAVEPMKWDGVKALFR